MGGEKTSYLAVGIALGLMSAILLFVYVNFFVANAYCEPTEHHGACTREWIGALSGWAATLAAAITVVFLYRQNSEQKKQTDFLLGNAQPTIDAIRHIRIPQVAVVRIVNWNRRPIILHKLRLDHLDHNHRFRRVVVWDRDDPRTRWVRRNLVGDTIDPPVPMHGWKDRSGPPCEVRIDIVALQGRRLSTMWDGASVTVELVVAGEDGEKISLHCPISTAG